MEVIELSVDEVQEPRVRIRDHIDEAKLQELEDSVAVYGVLVPVLVRKRGKRYEIVAGDRRVLAARHAGLATVPAIVVQYGDDISELVKYHENAFREDLNPSRRLHTSSGCTTPSG